MQGVVGGWGRWACPLLVRDDGAARLWQRQHPHCVASSFAFRRGETGHVQLTSRWRLQLLCVHDGGLSETRLNSRIELGIINKHNDASVCQWRNILHSRSCHESPPLFIAWRRVPFMFLQTSVNQSLPFKTKLSHMQNSCSSRYRDPRSRYSLLDILRHFCLSCVRSLSLQLVNILAKKS